MKEVKDKGVLNYVMNDLSWKADLPAYLKEIKECSQNTPYAKTFTIVADILQILARRAIELNDPVLNIIMLNLSLYEGSHDKNASEVKDKLREQIKQSNGKYDIDTELLDLLTAWFDNTVTMCDRVTTGNVSHQIATIKSHARRCNEFLKIYSNTL